MERNWLWNPHRCIHHETMSSAVSDGPFCPMSERILIAETSKVLCSGASSLTEYYFTCSVVAICLSLCVRFLTNISSHSWFINSYTCIIRSVRWTQELTLCEVRLLDFYTAIQLVTGTWNQPSGPRIFSASTVANDQYLLEGTTEISVQKTGTGKSQALELDRANCSLHPHLQGVNFLHYSCFCLGSSPSSTQGFTPGSALRNSAVALGGI